MCDTELNSWKKFLGASQRGPLGGLFHKSGLLIRSKKIGLCNNQRLNKVCNRIFDMICTHRTLLLIWDHAVSPMLWSGSARGVHNSKMVSLSTQFVRRVIFLRERIMHSCR